MDRGWWGRFSLFFALTVLAVAYVYPSLVNLDFEKSGYPIKDKITLGLDLQGGVYMVLGVDFDKVFVDVTERQMVSLESRLKEKHFAPKSVKLITKANDPNVPADDPKIFVQFEAKDKTKAYELIKTEFEILRLTADNPDNIELGLSAVYRGQIREKTIDQSREVIRNRIDEFGVAEPTIATQGNDRIVVELPGVSEIERAKGLIGRTAKLEWQLVENQKMSPDQLQSLIATIEKENNLTFKEGEKFGAYVEKINELARPKLPEGTEISFERRSDPMGGGVGRIPYLLKATPELTGDDLLDAQVSFDNDRNPAVSFSLNPRGASSFERVTGENVGGFLAIVLDNTVYSAPRINTRIGGGHGIITLGQSASQNDQMKEAKDLAIVLRAGALPAELQFLEQRVVGPSLGQDSIQKGATAGVIGCLLVFLFISFYYRVSGVIATVSLILNVIYVIAILIGLDATLTLPGIAGIALTVGIAVDSNVVIYERIREELRSGKSVMGAVEAGFQKAFRTIVDANVTNAAAAIVLMNFGTGPIKGFAVTLLIGIVTTVFTAVFVCRLAFDLYVKRFDGRSQAQLSI